MATEPLPQSADLYEADFYAWALEQAREQVVEKAAAVPARAAGPRAPGDRSSAGGERPTERGVGGDKGPRR